jgi:dihydroorotate dehydrogenase subfamily 2
MPSTLYKSIAKPLLFLMPPETSHGIAKWFFERTWMWKRMCRYFSVEDDRLHAKIGHLNLKNPVGLAAGFDKNCEMITSLFCIGFGYLTLGTITAQPTEGNLKPRIWRYHNSSLLNSMGLPNKGSEIISRKIGEIERREGPLILSVSGLSIEEFVTCYRELEAIADGVELNISTPNTIGVRAFQDPEKLKLLLDAITAIRSQKPLWVKIPPYFDEKERENVLNLVDICLGKPVDAITAINTRRIKEERSSIGTAGLSGREIFQDMLRIVGEIYNYTQGKIPINACGGIFSGADAWQAIESGASSIQLYTGLIYEGPRITANINRELLQKMNNSQLDSISELTGTAR